MQRTIFTFLATTLFATAIFAQGGGGGTKGKVEGAWEGKWGESHVTLKLHVEGTVLTGTLTRQVSCEPYCDSNRTPGVATEKIEGTVDDNLIEFTSEIGTTRGSFAVTFKGIAEDRLTLTPAGEPAFVLSRI
jgi:hypothetical protein